MKKAFLMTVVAPLLAAVLGVWACVLFTGQNPNLLGFVLAAAVVIFSLVAIYGNVKNGAAGWLADRKKKKADEKAEAEAAEADRLLQLLDAALAARLDAVLAARGITAPAPAARAMPAHHKPAPAARPMSSVPPAP